MAVRLKPFVGVHGGDVKMQRIIPGSSWTPCLLPFFTFSTGKTLWRTIELPFPGEGVSRMGGSTRKPSGQRDSPHVSGIRSEGKANKQTKTLCSHSSVPHTYSLDSPFLRAPTGGGIKAKVKIPASYERRTSIRSKSAAQ